MKNYFLLILTALFFFSSCKKAETNCTNINNLSIISNSPVTIGETMKFATQEAGGYRTYKWIGPNNYDSQETADSFTNAELKYEGWYYLSVNSLNDDCQKIDSFYFDVKLKQGTPSCTIANNNTTYSNLADDSYTSVSKGIESTYSQLALQASGGFFSNITIYFHTRWRTAEPEDGIYTTINTPLFDQIDYNYNKVFITTTKSSIYWSSWEGQTVYVSHIGNKLQVRFCNLNMGGYNGTSYTTVASGNIVEQ